MAKICDLCAKGPDFGNTRSHSMRATRTRREANLQRARFFVPGANSVKLKVCANCIRSSRLPVGRRARQAARRAEAAENHAV